MATSSVSIVVLGGLNSDYMIQSTALPRPGETIEGRSFEYVPGGKGANQAVAAARIGASVTMLGSVGEDERGERLLDMLATEGVETNRIIRNKDEQTGAAVIMVGGDGEKQIMTFPGANRRLAVGDVRRWADTIGQAQVLLTQLECPLDSTIMAIRIASERHIPVVLDTAPAFHLPIDLYPLLHTIRSNSTEAETLTGIRVCSRESARRAAQEYLNRGAQRAIVQGGDEGDLLLEQDREIWLPRHNVERVDATGAGDAFIGTFAVMLAEGRPAAEAGRFASAAAALATTRLGAQAALPTRESVTALLESDTLPL